MASRESLDLTSQGEPKSLLLRAEESRRAPRTGEVPAVADAGELACDHVIFTSVRTPMGEGYRIIAATSGMKPDERQAITQNAPSHDALCDSSAEAIAMAFYALPSGRLCVAHSSCAGSEHTGRGGHRIYTVSVVFDASHFERAAFNPFNVLRAMQTAGLTTPTLKPPPELPKVRLQVAGAGAAASATTLSFYPLDSFLDGATRQFVVNELLNDSKLVVCMEGDHLAAAEALLMALPGPARTRISIAAGLRFSVARSYRLSLVAEDAAVEARTSGQPIRLLKRGTPVPPTGRSGWTTFVEAYLATGRIGELAARTSRPFTDVSPNARQRLARLFTTLDTVEQADTTQLAAIAVEFVESRGNPGEKSIQDELLARTQRLLGERLGNADAVSAAKHWPTVVEIWRRSPEAAAHIRPVVDLILRRLAVASPCEAADLALAVARNVPDSVAAAGHAALLDEVVNRFATFGRVVEGEEDRRRVGEIARKWLGVRPGCKLIASVLESGPIAQAGFTPGSSAPPTSR